MSEITCYGRTGGRNWVQEWYETASRDAGRRARTLRKAGFRVSVECMGVQVTRVGRVKMTILSVHDAGLHQVPAPSKVSSI